MNNKTLYVKRLLMVLGLLLGMIAIYKGLDYAISDDTGSETRITFHDFYNEEDIDYLFVGPSHSVQGINAQALTELTGKNAYNLSTSAQDFKEGYYVLKEALDSKKVGQVFYEISVSRIEKHKINDTSVYIISDYMKHPGNRIKLLTEMYDSDKYMNAFFRLRRNIDPLKLPSPGSMKDLVERKSRETYRTYRDENYLGKGQWAGLESMAWNDAFAFNQMSYSTDNFGPEEVDETAWNDLQDIVDLCRERNVPLTFYIMPYTKVYKTFFEHYYEFTEMIYRFVQRNDTPLIDMNLVKSEYLMFTPNDFYNLDHICSESSGKMAEFLAAYIKEPGEHYFMTPEEEQRENLDEILAAGYVRYFITPDGEDMNPWGILDQIEAVRVEVSAYGKTDIPADSKLFAARFDENRNDWIVQSEIEGTKLDEYSTAYTIPFDGLKADYKIELINPADGSVMYEAISNFGMD